MSLPKRVTIELTNRCNRFCKECPRNKMKYPLGDMEWILLRCKIIEDLPPSTVIVPFFRGESLLHPRFSFYMDAFKKFDTVQLATNGDLLNRENQEAMLQTCSFVSLSLHEFTPPFGKRRLKFLKSARNNGTETQVSILETLIPEGQKERFVDAWLEHADKIRIYREHSHDGFGDICKNVEGNKPCQKPFEEMVVYWDGKVGLCNHDWNNSVHLGDLNTQTIEEVWNSRAYKKVRGQHRGGRRKTVPSCLKCDYWMTSYLENKMFGELYVNG